MRKFATLVAAALCSCLAVIGTANAAERSYGFVPTPKDKLESIASISRYRSYLPETVDLSPRFPTPREQGALNSCVGWAVGYAARSYYSVSVEKRARNNARDIPSPSYIYHSIRDPANCQSGSRILDALELLKKGSPSLHERPYDASCWRPTFEQTSFATDFQIESWWVARHPDRPDDIKGQLALGNPVIIGMDVTPSFERLQVGEIYRLGAGDVDVDGDTRFGKHAVTVVGYDDRKQAFKVINSWGTAWGEGGFGWVSYEAFSKVVLEAWVMNVAKKAPIPPPVRPKPKPDRELVVTPTPKPRQEWDAKPGKDEIAVVLPTPRPPTDDNQRPTSENDCQLVTSTKEGNRIRVTGFVATEDALERAKGLYPEPKHILDIELRPWPQCEVLMTLAERLDDADAPLLSVSGDAETLNAGDALVVEVTTPTKPAYIYISYIQADGSVVHLREPFGPVQSPTKSKTKFVFGDGKEGRARFTVSEPFGREMVVVLASASPLFDGTLSDKQVERDYLSALRKALIYKADPKLPDREVSAAFLGIVTKEK